MCEIDPDEAIGLANLNRYTSPICVDIGHKILTDLDDITPICLLE